MKNAVKLFSMLLVVGLLFVIVGCKPAVETPEPTPTPTPTVPVVTDYNALGGWTDGGDGVYTIITNTQSKLEFSYAKDEFPYAYMSSTTITQDLSVYKKLVLTVEGSGTMLLKLETSDSTPAKEIGINVTGIAGTYEWNLMASSAFLAKVNKVVIIAAPGKEDSIGTISVTQLKFGVAVASGFIINDGFNNIPSNVNEYNGTDEIFNFNNKWENFAEETYVITQDGTEFDVAFTKAAGFEWSAMQSRVQGNFTAFNFVVVKVTGTPSQPIIVKAANGVETRVILNGEMQEVVVDLSEMALADKNAINAILIFGNAGRTGTGVFTIHEAFMVDDYEYVAPVIVKNVYNGTDLTFDIHNWYDGGDQVYGITRIADEYLVEYNKPDANFHWSYMFANLEGDFSGFAKIEFEITGVANKTLLLKAESPVGVKEVPVTFDGTKQVFVFDLLTMTTAQLEQLNKIVLFAAPGGIGSGEFTIHSVTFMTSDKDVNANWSSIDAGTYTFTYGATTVVNYTKVAGQEWSAIRTDFVPAEVVGLNTLTLVLKGTAGKSVLVKPNDVQALEKTVSFVDALPVTVTVTADAFTSIIMFGEPGTAPATGSFEIVSATLSYVAADFDPTLVYNFNSKWVANVSTIYDIELLEEKTLVTYNKLAGNDWEWMRVQFDAQETAGLNTMTIVLKGTAGKQVLVKPNDSGALEKWITFTDSNPVTFTVSASAFTSVYVFGDPGVAPATGSFEILSAMLYYTADVNGLWVQNDPNTYAVVLGETAVVNYTKAAGQEWVFLKNNFVPGNVEGLNTIQITLKGTAGKSVMVKVNNAIEQNVTFVADTPVTLTFMVESITGLIIFAEPNVAPVTGSFEIISTKFMYMTPPPVATDVVVDFTLDGWIDNDGGIYTFTPTTSKNVVTYTKTEQQHWAFIKNVFDMDLANHNTIDMVVKGTIGAQLIIKPNDKGVFEKTVTFDGTEQAIRFTMNEAPKMILIFVDPINGSLTGTFEIISAKVLYVEPGVEVTSNWVDNDGGIYTIGKTGVVNNISYVKVAGQEWAFIKNEFVGDMSAFNTITMVLQGEAGKQLVIKPNDKGIFEKTVTFTGAEQVVVFTLTETPVKILMFVDPLLGSLTGSFEIRSTKLSYVEPAPLDQAINVVFTQGWVDNDGGIYTFTPTDGKNVVTYTKTVEQHWAFMKYTFTDNLANHNTITLVVKGEVGKQLIVKPNDSGAYEQTITFDGTEQTFTFTLTTTPMNVLIFVDPILGSLTGTFEIVSATVSFVAGT
ncbi:MAG: hypothetical protein Q7I99_01030 [Acholeplasmataceae bacterium]|nr:hypothetical protein [Acholeplasmataceae bacterium]